MAGTLGGTSDLGRGRVLGIGAAAALLCALAVGATPARDARHDAWPRRSRIEVTQIDVRGDLDSRRLARRVRDALDAASSSDHIVLRLDADRWRLDVVWMIALAMRDSPAPVSVFLDDPRDARVGLGALLLAVIANRSMVSPGTRVASGPDENLRRLAPEETDWDRIEREMSGLMWVALENRGLRPEIGDLLIRGAASLWVVDRGAGAGPIVSLEPPPERDARRIVDAAPDGAVRVEVSGALCRRLGLVDHRAGSVREALLAEGVARPRLEKTVLTSELAESRRRVFDLLAGSDRLIHRTERVFERVRRPPDDRVVPRSAYHEAARAANRLIARARRALAEAEHLFEEHPELVHLPAPEGTSVGRTRRGNASDWRWTFINRKRDLDRLADRAREYEAR